MTHRSTIAQSSSDPAHHMCTGSAWFETAVSRPALVLKDFVKVIHPDLAEVQGHKVGRYVHTITQPCLAHVTPLTRSCFHHYV